MKPLLASTAIALFGTAALAVEPADVMDTYAGIALAGYEDSLTTVQALKAAIDALIATPTDATLAAARAAWLAARVPYQQTEAYRFGNPAVDAWEGQVNAWPLDEGLIDYVVGGTAQNPENPFAQANIVANPTFAALGATIDATRITPALLQSLNEVEGIEENVATGYHAIEFLLWGQDLNGTGPGAGDRPATDFDTANCTGGNCDRRIAYLTAAADLMITDLEDAVAMWSDGGAARSPLMKSPVDGVAAAFTGLGSLSYAEMVSDRMMLGLMLQDPEEEHDCFSDNTHNSHYYDAVGVQNVYLGRYTRLDGSVLEGPSLYDLVAESDAALADRLASEIAGSVTAMGAIKAKGDSGFAYDQMIGGDPEGARLINAAAEALTAQARSIERVVKLLDLGDKGIAPATTGN